MFSAAHVERGFGFRFTSERRQYAGQGSGFGQDLSSPNRRVRRRRERRNGCELARTPVGHGESLRIRTTGLESKSERGTYCRRVDAAYIRQRSDSCTNDRQPATEILARLRKLYRPAGCANFTDILGSHYGPGIESSERNGWGQWHRADHDGIGMDCTVATGTGFVGQYPPAVQGLYESTERLRTICCYFFTMFPTATCCIQAKR